MEPGAAVPDDELVGDERQILSLEFGNATQEAEGLATRIEGWLETGVPPNEIAVLVRQQPHLIGANLIAALTARGIATRNENTLQDLTSEPIAALILNLIRVLANVGQPAAYGELMRLVNPSSLREEIALRRQSSIVRLLSTERQRFASDRDARSDARVWEEVVRELMAKVTQPVLHALSPAYQQGNRLNQVIKETLKAFTDELEKDGDPIAALKRMSEEEAVRILTIHKSKGLEFEKVIVLGVEHECFWRGRAEETQSVSKLALWDRIIGL